MAHDSSAGLAVALAYYHAWTAKDMDRAMTYIADDIVCEAPAGRIVGGERYHRTPFDAARRAAAQG